MRCLVRRVALQCLNACVVEEDVEFALLRSELFGGCLDRGQVAEIQMLKDQRALGLWPSLFDVRNSLIGLVLGSGSDVDFRVLGIKNLSYLLADTRVGACDDVDLERDAVNIRPFSLKSSIILRFGFILEKKFNLYALFHSDLASSSP